MTLRARISVLTISTFAVVVVALMALHVNSVIVTWLDHSLERSQMAGRELRAFMVSRINGRTAALPLRPVTVAETKNRWREIVRDDKEIPAMLVQIMVQSGSIVEIQIAGEDGVVLASSNAARLGSGLTTKPSLRAFRDTSPIDRFIYVLRSSSDYETRDALGIADQQAPVFQIQVLVSPILLRDAIIPELNKAAGASALALLLAAGLAYASAHIALRPLTRIGHSLDRIITGAPIESAAGEEREMAAVSSKLSLVGAQVTGARRDASQLRTTMGNLARAVAHEIKNPLNAISLRLELLRARLDGAPTSVDSDIEILQQEVSRLDRVVRTFLDLSRPVALHLQDVDLAALIDNMINLIRPEAGSVGTRIEWNGAPNQVAIRGDEGLIRQAILNILKNALEAMPVGGVLTVGLSVQDESCEISIADTGPGVSADLLDKLFEPFFSTKVNGTGIGLAMAQRAAQLHGGQIAVANNSNHGAVFKLRLPMKSERTPQ